MKEIEEIWNPTRRLYEALVNAKKHGTTLEPNRQKRSIRKVLGNVFEVNPNHTIEIYRGLRTLSESLDWTERMIEESSIRQKNNYTRNLPQIRKAIEIGNINDSWDSFEQYLTAEAMADLLHAATRLSEIHSEVSLSNQELEEITQELHTLIELFHSAEIDTDLRIAVLDLLSSASEILSEYRIRGGESLKKIVELALGRLITKQEKFKKIDRTLIGKLLAWLNKLDTLYGKLGKYAPLLPQSVGLLLGHKSE